MEKEHRRDIAEIGKTVTDVTAQNCTIRGSRA
jgi:hypothetical protein